MSEVTAIDRDCVFELRALERAAEWGPWIVETDSKKFGNNWTIYWFGSDGDVDVFVTTDGLHASECRTEGALADANLVAALRNNATALLDAAEWALENGYGPQLTLGGQK